ncbi:MAG: hypothetical protein E6120_11705 [Staphylococcus haemolyticus]|nr:hypothetical protein [Staphylococcus haemolyticus]
MASRLYGTESVDVVDSKDEAPFGDGRLVDATVTGKLDESDEYSFVVNRGIPDDTEFKGRGILPVTVGKVLDNTTDELCQNIVLDPGEVNADGSLEEDFTIVDDSLAGTLEDSLAGTLEDFLAGTLEDSLAGTVEDSLAGTLEDSLAGTLEDSLAGTLEDSLAGTLEDSLAGTLEDSLAGTLEDSLAGTLDDSLTGTLEDSLAGTLEDSLAGALEDSLAGTLEELRISDVSGANVCG